MSALCCYHRFSDCKLVLNVPPHPPLRFHRFGAVTAATAYTLFHKTPAVLAVFGFFFSMPCFYYIVAKPQYATTGRFVLLTYNLTCLFSCAPPVQFSPS